MKKITLLLVLGGMLSASASTVFGASDAQMLKKFRDFSDCKEFTCMENRTEEYSKKERARGALVSVCNTGDSDIRVLLRRKMVIRWEVVRDRWVKPGHCRVMHDYAQNLVRRQWEVRVDNPNGSVYHLMRDFLDDVLPKHSLDHLPFPRDSEF